MEEVADPYGNDPRRHPALIVHSAKPFNAETPKEILGEQLHTPNELFYVRHHLPVPHIKAADYRLEVKGAPSAIELGLSIGSCWLSRWPIMPDSCACIHCNIDSLF